MEKQSILGRITQMAKANIHAMLDSAEDPQKMLDQMIRDYTANISEAESAIAQTIGNLRLAEDDYREDLEEANTWGQKALAASNKAEELRGQDDAAGAEKFDKLARIAIERQMDAESSAKTAAPAIESQNEVVNKLKEGLEAMKQKRQELVSRRDQLVARAKAVQAQGQVQDAVKSINLLDPTSEVARFEEKIRREEARVRGQEELAASTLDSQFEELEDLGQQTEIEARLAALKSGQQPKELGS
ncbi:PspA/IM30 family protein [Enteractinococcus fodinae]|uniref:Phage shock protein A n=1 Tax=Enteractinococcus fodinae TaxID=684663 RepID=A0ABU2AXF8_9MICC|nr:PspA/IM30 family protein [Enteractinococcus fodinae]MDR7345851.1 phage shock protein A [Enteractinococcus fodinae]